MSFVLSSIRRAFGPNGDRSKTEPFFVVDQLSLKEISFSPPVPAFDQDFTHADWLEEFHSIRTRRTEDKKSDDFSADLRVQLEENFQRGPALGRGGYNIFDNESIPPTVAQEKSPTFTGRREKANRPKASDGLGGKIDIHVRSARGVRSGPA